MSFTVTPVRTAQDLEATTSLFNAYATSLNIDLSFQDYAAEISSMPGAYSPAHGGELLLARANATGHAIGCAALRQYHPATDPEIRRAGSDKNDHSGSSGEVCELKRLYVTAAARGMGLGRALSVHIIETAEHLGYSQIRLDTLPDMLAAQRMYRKLGFANIPAYRHNPVPGTQYLALKLPRSTATAAAADPFPSSSAFYPSPSMFVSTSASTSTFEAQAVDQNPPRQDVA